MTRMLLEEAILWFYSNFKVGRLSPHNWQDGCILSCKINALKYRKQEGRLAVFWITLIIQLMNTDNCRKFWLRWIHAAINRMLIIIARNWLRIFFAHKQFGQECNPSVPWAMREQHHWLNYLQWKQNSYFWCRHVQYRMLLLHQCLLLLMLP